VYARQVVEAAIESRSEESTAPEWPTVPPQERSELERAIRQLAHAVGQHDLGSSR
jgi:hypothetical protein